MWSAAILAGGQARRFGGHDKSALMVGGRPILERQIDELSKLTTDILIVGGHAAGSGPSTSLRAGRARLVADRIPESGPLAGLHAALNESQGSATIVIACDMPYVSAPFLRYLLELTRDADAVVPRTERGDHPLCAAYTRACVAPAASRLAGTRLKMAGLLEDVRVRVVTIEEIDAFGDHHRLLANVNTPAEYEGLEALQGHQL
jgi:molybdopterin-guanine dinucleotide biosynthesis protein A